MARRKLALPRKEEWPQAATQGKCWGLGSRTVDTHKAVGVPRPGSLSLTAGRVSSREAGRGRRSSGAERPRGCDPQDAEPAPRLRGPHVGRWSSRENPSPCHARQHAERLPALSRSRRRTEELRDGGFSESLFDFSQSATRHLEIRKFRSGDFVSPDFSADAEKHYLEAVARRDAIRDAWEADGSPLLATGSTGQLGEHPYLKMLREHDLLVDRLGAVVSRRHRGPEPSAVLKPSIGKSPAAKLRAVT